jgi:hypothetical protein
MDIKRVMFNGEKVTNFCSDLLTIMSKKFISMDGLQSVAINFVKFVRFCTI